MKAAMDNQPVTISDQIRAMAVGSTLIVRRKTRNSVKALASRIGKANGWRYITRQSGKASVRVWRIA